MNKGITKKLVVPILSASLLFTTLAGCGGSKQSDADKTGSTDGQKNGKPATWIADRHIKARAFVDDLGVSLPSDQINNDVAKKIKELTGITLEWQYTAGKDREMLMAAIASGDLPDVIVHYLNNSSRPEFPIVLKAAREGMFTDLAPFLKKTKVYSKYFQPDYLPSDSAKNIVFRPEFNGAVYMVHMDIPRVEGANERDYRGGMYIQKSIADALKIESYAIKSQDDLYNLLKKIKEGNFKDNNGKPVYPLGPSIWGGNNHWMGYPVNNYAFSNVSEGFAIIDGKIVHESETGYGLKQVEFYQKLLKEGLVHPELFTIDATRAEEGVRSNSYAIISDTHNYMDFLEKTAYLPVGPLEDVAGTTIDFRNGKAGYGAWEIPKTTKNPEEIVKFADFLASKEGKLLWMYGIEGKHYDMVNGKPVPKKEIMELKEKDAKAAYDTAIYMGGNGSLWGWALGNTDVDAKADFGELEYGQNANPKKLELPLSLFKYGTDKRPIQKVYKSSFGPLSFMGEFSRQTELKPLLDKYDEYKIKAVFSKSPEEAKKILDNYKMQLDKAGFSEYKENIMKIHKDDPKQYFIRELKSSDLKY